MHLILNGAIIMSRIAKKIRRIVNENRDMLNALEEYDRTGKLRKITYKTRVNFTVDEDTFNKFRSYCRKNSLNMSDKIESFMKGEIKGK